MNKEEIKEHLKRVDELEAKLTGEEKETLQWLIYGYNQCAKLLNETEQENKQLKEELKYTVPIVEHNKIVSEKNKENKQLKEVIEEVREYILNHELVEEKDNYVLNVKELLQILDKAKERINNIVRKD